MHFAFRMIPAWFLRLSARVKPFEPSVILHRCPLAPTSAKSRTSTPLWGPYHLSACSLPSVSNGVCAFSSSPLSSGPSASLMTFPGSTCDLHMKQPSRRTRRTRSRLEIPAAQLVSAVLFAAVERVTVVGSLQLDDVLLKGLAKSLFHSRSCA